MVPVDPIFQARSVLFDDAFRDYSIPKSIMKLKQGFGRLIRTKSDTGVAIFLDDRIFSTRWGERYFSAFPSTVPKKISSTESLLSIIEK
jgi:Rad3-related DNA helicase